MNDKAVLNQHVVKQRRRKPKPDGFIFHLGDEAKVKY